MNSSRRAAKASTPAWPSEASATVKPITSRASATISLTVGSSSTRSTRPWPRSGLPAGSAGAWTAAVREETGNWRQKVVPSLTRLSTRREPLWLLTIPRMAASPSPRPVNLVVKKGSKIRLRVSSSMPHPSSWIRTYTQGPASMS